MIILDWFSDFSSVESEFCIEEKFVIKLALLFNFLCDSFIKPKKAAVLFYKKWFLSILDLIHWEMNKISYPIKRLEN